LTSNRRQRICLAQAFLALIMTSAGILTMYVGAARGIVDPRPLGLWSAVSVAGFVVVGLAIRLGLTLRLADPSLTLAQMVHATACAAWAYTLAGSAHATVPLVLALILIFGMFGMTTRQVVWVAIYVTLVFGSAMGWSSCHDPAHYPPDSDELVFFMLFAVIVGIVILTARLHRIRDRARQQRRALEEALDKIQRLATHDELTGLYNRRHMQQRLEDERARSQRDRHPWCVALIDLDHFKRINDAYGHASGDEVLRTLAQRTAALIRKTDSLGRWGGEEFVLLLPVETLETAHCSIDRVRDHFHHHPIQLGDTTLSLSFSAGVTQHRPGETVAQTLERADRLMYRAKELGRNRVESDQVRARIGSTVTETSGDAEPPPWITPRSGATSA
jgi:diguanylate cyclase (GGDEF)-like protein